MTTTVCMIPRRRIHWVQLGRTWCGRRIYSGKHTCKRTHEQVRQDMDDGKWCKVCAAAWWMAVGSKEAVGGEEEDQP